VTTASDFSLSNILVYFPSFYFFCFVVKQMFNKPNRRFAFYAFLLAGKIRRCQFYSPNCLLFIVVAFFAWISAALKLLIGLRIKRCLTLENQNDASNTNKKPT